MKNENDLGQGQGHTYQGQTLKYGQKWLLCLVSIALAIWNIIISMIFSAQMMLRCHRDISFLEFVRNDCCFHDNW